ncbi:unnamed protein product [Amoebophrya sp. A120]|nr:unnamed protein product [Amoebophrya sp. A120]|eukprot:GSA120T00015759001.1
MDSNPGSPYSSEDGKITPAVNVLHLRSDNLVHKWNESGGDGHTYAMEWKNLYHFRKEMYFYPVTNDPYNPEYEWLCDDARMLYRSSSSSDTLRTTSKNQNPGSGSSSRHWQLEPSPLGGNKICIKHVNTGEYLRVDDWDQTFTSHNENNGFTFTTTCTSTARAWEIRKHSTSGGLSSTVECRRKTVYGNRRLDEEAKKQEEKKNNPVLATGTDGSGALVLPEEQEDNAPVEDALRLGVALNQGVDKLSELEDHRRGLVDSGDLPEIVEEVVQPQSHVVSSSTATGNVVSTSTSTSLPAKRTRSLTQQQQQSSQPPYYQQGQNSNLNHEPTVEFHDTEDNSIRLSITGLEQHYQNLPNPVLKNYVEGLSHDVYPKLNLLFGHLQSRAAYFRVFKAPMTYSHTTNNQQSQIKTIRYLDVDCSNVQTLCGSVDSPARGQPPCTDPSVSSSTETNSTTMDPGSGSGTTSTTYDPSNPSNSPPDTTSTTTSTTSDPNPRSRRQLSSSFGFGSDSGSGFLHPNHYCLHVSAKQQAGFLDTDSGTKACVRDFCMRQSFCGGYEIVGSGPSKQYRLLLIGSFERNDNQGNNIGAQPCGSELGLSPCPTDRRCFQLVRPKTLNPMIFDQSGVHSAEEPDNTKMLDVLDVGYNKDPMGNSFDLHEVLRNMLYKDKGLAETLKYYSLDDIVQNVMTSQQEGMDIISTVNNERVLVQRLKTALDTYIAANPPVSPDAWSDSVTNVFKVKSPGEVFLEHYPEYYIHDNSKNWDFAADGNEVVSDFIFNYFSLRYRPFYELPTCPPLAKRGYAITPALTATSSSRIVSDYSNLALFSGENAESYSPNHRGADNLASMIPGRVRATLTNPRYDVGFNQCLLKSYGGHFGVLAGTFCDVMCIANYQPMDVSDYGSGLLTEAGTSSPDGGEGESESTSVVRQRELQIEQSTLLMLQRQNGFMCPLPRSVPNNNLGSGYNRPMQSPQDKQIAFTGYGCEPFACLSLDEDSLSSTYNVHIESRWSFPHPSMRNAFGSRSGGAITSTAERQNFLPLLGPPHLTVLAKDNAATITAQAAAENLFVQPEHLQNQYYHYPQLYDNYDHPSLSDTVSTWEEHPVSDDPRIIGLAATTEAVTFACEVPNTSPANVFHEARCVDGEWYPEWVQSFATGWVGSSGSSGSSGISFRSRRERQLEQKKEREERRKLSPTKQERVNNKSSKGGEIAAAGEQQEHESDSANTQQQLNNIPKPSAFSSSASSSGSESRSTKPKPKSLLRHLQQHKSSNTRKLSTESSDPTAPLPQCVAAAGCPTKPITDLALRPLQYSDRATALTATTVPTGTMVSLACPLVASGQVDEAGNDIYRDYEMTSDPAEIAKVMELVGSATQNNYGVRTATTTTTMDPEILAADSTITTTTTLWDYPGWKLSQVTRICYDGVWMSPLMVDRLLSSPAARFQKAFATATATTTTTAGTVVRRQLQTEGEGTTTSTEGEGDSTETTTVDDTVTTPPVDTAAVAETTTTTTTLPFLSIRERNQFPACKKIAEEGEVIRTSTVSVVALSVGMALDSSTLAALAARGTEENPDVPAIVIGTPEQLLGMDRLTTTRTHTEGELTVCFYSLENADTVQGDLIEGATGSREVTAESYVYIGTIDLGDDKGVVCALNYAGGTGLTARRRLTMHEDDAEKQQKFEENYKLMAPAITGRKEDRDRAEKARKNLAARTRKTNSVVLKEKIDEYEAAGALVAAGDSSTSAYPEAAQEVAEKRQLSTSVTTGYNYEYRASGTNAASVVAQVEAAASGPALAARLTSAVSTSLGCTAATIASCITGFAQMISFAIRENVVVEVNEWRFKPWKACSNQCGEGTKEREFYCDQSVESGNTEPCPFNEIWRLKLEDDCVEWGGCVATILCPMTAEYGCAWQTLMMLAIFGAISTAFTTYMYCGCKTPKGGNIKGLAKDGKSKMRWSKGRDQETGKQKIIWHGEDVQQFMIAEGFVFDKDEKLKEEDGAEEVVGAPVQAEGEAKPPERFFSMESMDADIPDEGAILDTSRLKQATMDIDAEMKSIEEIVVKYPEPPACLKIGENLEYYSTTYSLFLPAKITAHDSKTGTCSVVLSARLSAARQTRSNVPFAMLRIALRENERCEIFVGDQVGWLGPVFVKERVNAKGRGAEYIVTVSEEVLHPDVKVPKQKTMRVELTKVRRLFEVDDEVVVHHEKQWLKGKVVKSHDQTVAINANNALLHLQERVALRKNAKKILSPKSARKSGRSSGQKLQRESTFLSESFFGGGASSPEKDYDKDRDSDDDGMNDDNPLAIVPVDTARTMSRDSENSDNHSGTGDDNNDGISSGARTPRKKFSRQESVAFNKEEYSQLSARRSLPPRTPRKSDNELSEAAKDVEKQQVSQSAQKWQEAKKKVLLRKMSLEEMVEEVKQREEKFPVFGVPLRIQLSGETIDEEAADVELAKKFEGEIIDVIPSQQMCVPLSVGVESSHEVRNRKKPSFLAIMAAAGMLAKQNASAEAEGEAGEPNEVETGNDDATAGKRLDRFQSATSVAADLGDEGIANGALHLHSSDHDPENKSPISPQDLQLAVLDSPNGGETPAGGFQSPDGGEGVAPGKSVVEDMV